MWIRINFKDFYFRILKRLLMCGVQSCQQKNGKLVKKLLHNYLG